LAAGEGERLAHSRFDMMEVLKKLIIFSSEKGDLGINILDSKGISEWKRFKGDFRMETSKFSCAEK